MIRLLFTALAFLSVAAAAQSETTPYAGQPGKDVVWVPTPYTLVEKMLDMARVTRKDYVIDLGSGDGRNVIAAAKRGARALGVEYDRQLLEIARKNAADAGVAKKARFVHGDMFEADISRATVLALFLLPDNLRKKAKASVKRYRKITGYLESRSTLESVLMVQWLDAALEVIQLLRKCVNHIAEHDEFVGAITEGGDRSGDQTLGLRRAGHCRGAALERSE